MPVELKFCGLTRRQDAEMAISLGAAYLGVIFAPSTRQVTVDQAQRVFATADTGMAKRVGVFGGSSVDEIARAAEELKLDVIQLHGAGDAKLVDALRERVAIRIWNVLHIGDDGVAAALGRANEMRGDATLLDAHVDGMLGGTGTSFDWQQGRDAVDALRARGPIILAGGLRPENVGRAIELLSPDVVDVSSGVESAPGIKNHERMRAFALAAFAAHGAPKV